MTNECITLPPPTYRVGRPRKYPWLEMKVNEYFLVSEDAGRARAAAGQANRRYRPKKFITRTVDDGVRVWRVK